ncbi:MAG: hypothetical protein PHS80_11215 [Methanothrix sp.]|nr:hypothetical protein [Methanothrix sp.]MDD4446373.1 hypothetical protein [Methanothrix sp.]
MFFIRQVGAIQLIAALLFGMAVSAVPVCSASTDYQDLLDLSNANEDMRINAQDLAFLLVTHNFDATPKGDHVEVRINGSIYLVTPNAGKAGLADIVLA